MKNKILRSLIIGIITIQVGFSNVIVFAEENSRATISDTTLESREIFIDSLPEEEKEEVIANDSEEVVLETYEFFEYQFKESGKQKLKEINEKIKNDETIKEEELLNKNDYKVVRADLEKFKESKEIQAKNSLLAATTASSRPYEVMPGMWVNEDLNNPVLMHGIKVIRNSTNNRRFTATSSFTWSRSPYINTTDAVGITCSPNMVAISGTAKAYAEAFIPVANNPTLVVNILKEGPKIAPYGIGVAAAVSVKGAATINTGYVKSDFQFSDTGSDLGIITSEYLSKSISISDSLSFDTSGRPSIGLESTSTRYSKAVNVYKYNE